MTEGEGTLPGTEQFRILGISGSLREGSYNTQLLRAAAELAPEGVQLTIFDGLREIPPYDEDDRLRGEPAPVIHLKNAIREADALLIATPEYNHGVPGVLKNAIDWASRPVPENPFVDKPTAIMGASAGPMGTVRAQGQLREVLGVATPIVHTPEVLVANAPSRFDEGGRLRDEPTRQFVATLVQRLVDWADTLSPQLEEASEAAIG